MEHISMSLFNFMENLGQRTFGRSRKECWEKGLCIDCGEPADQHIYTQAGRVEYTISCLCEDCYNKIKVVSHRLKEVNRSMK